VAAKGKSAESEFLPILDDLIVEFCRRLRSSRKAITAADLTKLLEVRTKLGGPVSQKSNLWQMIEQIRQEKAPQTEMTAESKEVIAANGPKVVSKAKSSRRSTHEK
jgi:hypothetical protein